MPEVLEIQVKDSGPQQLAGPPRLPAAPTPTGPTTAVPVRVADQTRRDLDFEFAERSRREESLARQREQDRERLDRVRARRDFEQRLASPVSAVGRSAAQVAGLDASAGVAGAAAGLGAVPVIGLALAGAVLGLKGFADALSSTAQKLAPFSASLSVAQAQAEFTRFQGDLRRGQQLGPELAEFVKARTKLEETGKDLLADLLEPLIPIATSVLETLADVLRWVRYDLPNVFIDAYNVLVDALNTITEALPFIGEKVLGKLDRIEGNTRKDQEVLEDPFLKEFLQIERQGGADRAAGGIDDALRIPAFGGL